MIMRVGLSLTGNGALADRDAITVGAEGAATAGVGHVVLDFLVPTPREWMAVRERFAADVRPRVGEA